jgi:protein-tyrosine phosphatase
MLRAFPAIIRLCASYSFAWAIFAARRARRGCFALAGAACAAAVVELDSAGTHDYHVGEPPDDRSIAAALRRGIDLSALRARTVRTSDFDEFDLILAMDEQNLRELRRRAPAHRHERIRLMMEFGPDASLRAVPDPYYGGRRASSRCWTCSKKLRRDC